MSACFRALFLAAALPLSFSALLPNTSLASNNLQTSRAPRTQGIEPDARTKAKLVAIADRHAAKAGVPVELVRAIIRVESDWDKELTGHAGEIGLMQIKPETARDMGFSGKADALYEPETNIRWGVAYLAAAYKLAKGDVCQTVLKYNGGHAATKMTDAAGAYCGRVRGIIAAN